MTVSSNYIITYSGKKFYFDDPQPDQISVEDIAHSLANTGRFNGHTKHFYSVAQHCCKVHDLLGGGSMGWYGLFHDASEAYTGDMVSPLKRLLPDFNLYEDKIQYTIWEAILPRYEWFHLGGDVKREVKKADIKAFTWEVRDMHRHDSEFWTDFTEEDISDLPKLQSWSPSYAKGQFMRRYNVLRRMETTAA